MDKTDDNPVPSKKGQKVTPSLTKEELATDKSGCVKIGDIVLITIKIDSFNGMISADGVISQSVTAIPKACEGETGANVLTRSCLFRIEKAMKIVKNTGNKWKSELKLSIGKTVTYGERVQLRHLHSMSFISMNSSVMAAEAGCLQIEMNEESNEISWFEIVATSKLRKEGEFIHYADSMYFTMMSKKSLYYLHADESSQVASGSRLRINASGTPNPWKLRRYASFDLMRNVSGFVQTGDSFRILHKLSAGYLATNEKTQGNMPEVFIEKGNLTSNSLWEIQKTATFSGGIAFWQAPYRIKHVATGYLLQEIGSSIILTTKASEEGTLFSFIPDQQLEEPHMKFGIAMCIQTHKKRYLNLELPNVDENDTVKQETKFKIEVISSTRNFTGVAFVLEDVAEEKTAHVYRLSLVNPYLADLYGFLGEMIFDDGYFRENPERIKKLKDRCEGFAGMIENISKHIIFKADAEASMKERQDAIRELGILQLLLDISALLHDKVKESKKSSKVILLSLEKVYKLIYHSIKGNQQSSQQLVLKEKVLIGQLTHGLSRGVGHILKEIFKYATEISQITDESFTKWYVLLKTITGENIKEQALYLSILRFLCQYRNTGVQKYQSLALKALANPHNDFTILKFHILNKRAVIELDYPTKNCNLKKFLNDNPMLHSEDLVVDEQNLLVEQDPINALFYIEDLSKIPKYAGYVACAVEFLANVCLGRYSKALHQLPIITGISLPHIAMVLKNPDVSEKIRAAYANLCRTLIIDIDPFVPCSQHTDRCYEWDSLKGFRDQTIAQRMEVLSPIREILKSFWDKDGVAIDHENPGKSISLVVSMLKMTRYLIDLGMENDEFIEFFMQPLCFFMMKEAGDDDHWSTGCMVSIKLSIESGMNPSLENQLAVLHEEIMQTLKVITVRRQNVHVQEMLELFKEDLVNKYDIDYLENKYKSIVQKLDWNISVKYFDNVTDAIGNVTTVENEKTYHLGLYLLELLFDVSDGKNKQIHDKALSILLKDLNFTQILADDLILCEFLYDTESSEIYNNMLLLTKRLESTVALLVQEQNENSDSIQVHDAIKDSTIIIQDCIGMYKNLDEKVLFQNLMFHSGLYRLLMKILNLNYSKIMTNLFTNAIKVLFYFCKNNRRNQRIIHKLVKRIIDLIPYLSVTRLLCEAVADLREETIGEKALSVVLKRIDTEGCTIEYLRFLRGFLLDFDKKRIKTIQVRVLKAIFNSPAIKNILEDPSLDAFHPNSFFEPNQMNPEAFLMHLELMKTVIACTIENDFGIVQCRRMISPLTLRHYVTKPELSYEAREIYLKYLQLVFFSGIEGEVEPECNVNILDTILDEVFIPDVKKFKPLLQPLIEIGKKGGFNDIMRKKSHKDFTPTPKEQEVINYWSYLCHKSTWCNYEGGILNIFGDIFIENGMSLDEKMEEIIRQFKVCLYELTDTLQSTETIHKEFKFSRFISAGNILREALPRAPLVSDEVAKAPKMNPVLEALQKYIVEHKLTLEDAFSHFDVDESGNIDFEEFRTSIRRLLGNLSSSEIEMAFNDMDDDHSGTLKFSEFANKIRKYFSKNPRVISTRKQINEQTFALDDSNITIDIHNKAGKKEALEEFIKKFVISCQARDLIALVEKIKDKYITPALETGDKSIAEPLCKLYQVFTRPKEKIYLIRIFKSLMPHFEPKVVIFDEPDAEEARLKSIFIAHQELLAEVGVLRIAFSLIDQDNSIDLVKESVELILLLLKYGNSKIQTIFLELLQSINTSKFFSYIRSQLRFTRDSIVKRAHEDFLEDPDLTIDKTLVNPETDYSRMNASQGVKKPTFYLAKHLLELLQLCCENCFLPFQHYLRCQNPQNPQNKGVNINMVEEIALFLLDIRQLGGNIFSDPEAANMVIQCFETLIDCCKGPCVENQILLGTKMKLHKFINSTIHIYNCNRDFGAIFKSAVRLLSALLEGSFPLEIAKAMIDHLDFELLANIALEIYREYIVVKKSALLQELIVGTGVSSKLMQVIRRAYAYFKRNLVELELEEWIMISVGFEITIITVKLREKFRDIEELRWLCFFDEQPGNEGSENSLPYILNSISDLGGYSESITSDLKKTLRSLLKLNNSDCDMNEAYEFYASLTSSVEIYKDGQIEKCYFQMPTCIVYLNEYMRSKIIYGMNRNSNEEKIKSFVFLCNKILLELNHLQTISRVGILGWMTSKYRFFATTLFVSIICANIIVVLTVSNASDRDYSSKNFSGDDLMNFLGFIIVFTSIIMYLLSILFTYPVIIFEKLHQEIQSQNTYQAIEGGLIGTVKLQQRSEGLTEKLIEIVDYTKYVFIVLMNSHNLVDFALLILSMLGWYNPYIYGFMMLDILRRSKTLKNILLVITKNKRSLFLALLLLVIIVYIYGVLAFAIFSEYYQENIGNYSFNTYCQTLWLCFTNTFNLGLRSVGGIGDVLYPAFRGDKDYTSRIIFDISFFIIVIVILLSIIFGIIVDTFAELRDARRETEHDIDNCCFVCGRMKHEFELRGSGWSQHTQVEHNIWAYLAYVIYITKKPMNECDGIEKYVKGKILQNDVTFFPPTAICLEERKEKKENKKEEVLKGLEEIEEFIKSNWKK